MKIVSGPLTWGSSPSFIFIILRFNLFKVPQISWMFYAIKILLLLFVLLLDLAFPLTKVLISSIVS